MSLEHSVNQLHKVVAGAQDKDDLWMNSFHSLSTDLKSETVMLAQQLRGTKGMMWNVQDVNLVLCENLELRNTPLSNVLARFNEQVRR